MSSCTVRLGAAHFVTRPGETLLLASQRCAVSLPHSCGAGSCHACMLRVVAGDMPPDAQKGLPDHLRARRYVLACRCVPRGDLVLALPDPADQQTDGLLLQVHAGGDYVHLALESARLLICRAGDTLELDCGGPAPLPLEVTWVEPETFRVEGLCRPDDAAASAIAVLDFGHAVRLRGPLPLDTRAATEVTPPRPDPALWTEIGEARVHSILQAFYAEVYQDEQLSPFFHGVTLQRAVEKQHSFMRQLITGEKVYFGDRPRNAHHWMVVSDALFDHRQSLMRAHLLRAGLTQAQAARWQRLEAGYRPDIVKQAPWPRRIGDQEWPLEGYAREVLAEATLCDHCQRAVAAGEAVQYHVRLGTVSCADCAAPERALA